MIDRTLSTRPRANPKHGAWWDDPDDDRWAVLAANAMQLDFGREKPGPLAIGIIWFNRARRTDDAVWVLQRLGLL